jgi:uncharacterized protein DUF3658
MGYSESFNEIEGWRDELRRTHAGDAIVRAFEDRIEAEADPQKRQILNCFLADEHIAQGNRAAAEDVHSREPTQDIYRWYDDWWDNEPDDVVPAIEARIRHESHPMRLGALRWLLAQEHRGRGDYPAAETVYLADFAADPDEPRPLISLARQKLADQDQPEEAMRIIDRAIAAATRGGIFRREALGVKARIALRLAAYPIVEDVLRQIMRLTFTPGNLDAEAERDVLDRLPSGAVDADVARAYDAYCRASGWVGTASDQQIDGLIMSFAAGRWKKIAMIVAEVLSACKRESMQTTAETIADRVRRLVADGKLRSQGDLSKMRRGEVKLAGPVLVRKEGNPVAGG